MFELHVYYHDVLRYTVLGSTEKAKELRNQGFYVEVRAITIQH